MNGKRRRDEGFVLWFTGLPCSGKTTAADKAAAALKEKGRKIERLDGDVVRKSLSSDLGFSRQDREENLKRVAFVCRLLSRNGIGAVASFVSPCRRVWISGQEPSQHWIRAIMSMARRADCTPSSPPYIAQITATCWVRPWLTMGPAALMGPSAGKRLLS